VVVDQRGYAPTARPDDIADYRLPELVADAIAVLEAEGGRAPLLIGHDWGAVVAWAVAAQIPDRLGGLVALSIPHPAAYQRALETDPDQQLRSSYLAVFRRTGQPEALLSQDGGRRLRAMFAGAQLTTTTVEAYIAPFLLDPGTLTGALNWYRAIGPEDLAAVDACAVPASYLWGEGDTAVGPAAVAGCADYVTGAFETITLPGIGHWIPDQAPAAVAEAVLRRLDANQSEAGWGPAQPV
jgi:pimeloyl-ACP methyl ester carboxylesterase